MLKVPSLLPDNLNIFMGMLNSFHLLFFFLQCPIFNFLVHFQCFTHCIFILKMFACVHAQSCLTILGHHSRPGSSVSGIFPAGILEELESQPTQSCLTLGLYPMDCSLPGSSNRPWDFPGKNAGVDCHFLLQDIFPTQGLNPGLPHCRQTLYRLSHQGSL